MRILITGGATREAIDPVRFISNKSSGKMATALAKHSAQKGDNVFLVKAHMEAQPEAELKELNKLANVKITSVSSAEEMFAAVKKVVAENKLDVAILVAAVVDFAPAEIFSQKLKKSGTDEMTLLLKKTPDILASMRSKFDFGGLLIGFSAETQNVQANASEKLKRKKCDFIIANDVSRSDIGFDSAENEVVIISKSGKIFAIPKASKQKIAQEIFKICVDNKGN